MEYKALHERVRRALCKFLSEDWELLAFDVNERSITHKLAEHLQHQFKSFKVDCEYNRDEERPKAIHLTPEDTKTDSLEAKTVYPDIIVHHRGGRCNELMIEVKKSSMPDVYHDQKKLRAFTDPDNDYCYSMALLLIFDIKEQRIKSAQCFRHGQSHQCHDCEKLTQLPGHRTYQNC